MSEVEAMRRGLEIRLHELDQLIREQEQFVLKLRLRKAEIRTHLGQMRGDER